MQGPFFNEREIFMHVYTNLFGLHIPSYGLMITIGVITANIVALCILRKYRNEYDLNDFIVLEGYCLLGAMIGAKLLYLMVSFRSIEWSRITELGYLNGLMQGGFVFYGGLIGGLLALFVAAKVHHLDAMKYIRRFIFLIPMIHGFGRIGCFMAGCCYGIPYHGFGAVVFPEESFAVPGVELFPVQIVEAVCLLVIALLMLFLQGKYGFGHTLELYLILYGILRFILEYFRYDDARGSLGSLSTSQWISILLVASAIAMIVLFNRQADSPDRRY